MNRTIMHGLALLGLVLGAAAAFGFTSPPQAAGGLDVSDVNVVYNFGRQIAFQAVLHSSVPIRQASISFRESRAQITRIEPLTLQADGSTLFEYNLAQNVLPPFATIIFSYQATLVDGRNVTSAPLSFRYEDNRFVWKTLSEGQSIRVHWVQGGDDFGQAALDAARSGLEAINQIVPVTLDAPVDVYVYASIGDLQGALALGGQPWLAGHADPALGVAMVSVAPGETQSIELQRQIPHELAHVMLYRYSEAGYGHLPAWLNEGVASMSELYPNPDYASALTLAGQNGSLLPMADLCASFPAESGRAFLAYAESESFVRYLRDTHGNSGLAALIHSYADGLDCDLGPTRALGTSLQQLEARWREATLGENPVGVAARNLLPYFIMLALVLLVPLWGVLGFVLEKRSGHAAEK